MSSLIFFEVVQRGHRPVVDIGRINVRDAFAPRRAQGVRLCFYVQDKKRQADGLKYEFFRRLQQALLEVSDPRSSMRECLPDREESHDPFFGAMVSHFTRIAREDVEKWLDKDSVVIEADGNPARLLALLDAVHEEDLKVENRPAATVAAEPEDPHQAAIAFRNELLARNWPDGKSVAALLGMAVDVANPNQYAYRLRRNGTLFGVWSPSERSYRYPDFQFEHGMLRPEVEDLLAVLPVKEDKGGWRIAFWLFSPHALLDGKEPASVFIDDPQKVIGIAKQEFSGEQDAGW
jgi:hypothetical protein